MRPFLVVALLLAPVLSAQSKTFESPRGFRLKLPKNFREQALDPKERLVLGAFAAEGTGGPQIWVVRWAKATGPKTGEGEGDGEAEGAPQSLKDAVTEAYNKASSLQELLDLRVGEGKHTVKASERKSVTTKDGRAAVVFDAGDSVRAYLCDDGLEQSGIVGFGRLAKPWDGVLEDVAKSLEFVAAAGAGEAAIAKDLRDPAFRQQVRSRMPQGWEAHDTENFVLITNCKNKAVIKSMLGDLEIMRTCYLARFPPVGPMDKVSLVRVFASYEEYTAYGKLDGALGHFSALDDELVLFDPGRKVTKRQEWLKDIDPSAVLYHEAMHQYLHEANGLLAPASWFGEGFGEVFGGAVLDRRKGVVARLDKNPLRMSHIKESQKTKRWPDLRGFVKMTQPMFYGSSVYQNYAFAWAFCYFLEEQRKDPKGNKEWAAIPDQYLKNLREVTAEFRAKLPDDAPKDWIMGLQFEIQDQTFDRTFASTDWKALEDAWVAAMRKW